MTAALLALPEVAREWTRIQLGSEGDPYTYWISGIYKVVSYRAGEFLAYYLPDHFKNWGDRVATPPNHGKYDKCWSSLEAAQAACVTHAATYEPSARTVKRAAEIVAALSAPSSL